MRILFLDDSNERHRKFAREHIGCVISHCHDAGEAIRALAWSIEQDIEWDLVSLDHDLSEAQTMQHLRGAPPPDEGTGYDVAVYMERHPVKAKRVVIHSMNPGGSQRMAAALRAYRPHRRPFGMAVA